MFCEIVRVRSSREAKVTHYIKDDLHMPWKKVLHERNWPLFKGLLHSHRRQLVNCPKRRTQHRKTHGKDCVVCEEERVGHNRPCAVPRKFFIIEKDSHKLDDGQCWMSLFVIRRCIPSKKSGTHIIELDRIICACPIISDTNPH